MEVQRRSWSTITHFAKSVAFWSSTFKWTVWKASASAETKKEQTFSAKVFTGSHVPLLLIIAKHIGACFLLVFFFSRLLALIYICKYSVSLLSKDLNRIVSIFNLRPALCNVSCKCVYRQVGLLETWHSLLCLAGAPAVKLATFALESFVILFSFNSERII